MLSGPLLISTRPPAAARRDDITARSAEYRYPICRLTVRSHGDRQNMRLSPHPSPLRVLDHHALFDLAGSESQGGGEATSGVRLFPRRE